MHPCRPTMRAVARQLPELQQLTALAAAGYDVFAVDGNKPYTVLAPTNAALQTLAAGARSSRGACCPPHSALRASPAAACLLLRARHLCIPGAQSRAHRWFLGAGSFKLVLLRCWLAWVLPVRHEVLIGPCMPSPALPPCTHCRHY